MRTHTELHLGPRRWARVDPIVAESREPVDTVLRRHPIIRWTAWAANGLVYRLWQHEKLGWWVRTDRAYGNLGIANWRPVVTPMLLAIADGEPLTLTFCDWPTSPHGLAHLTDLWEHEFWYDAGPIKKLVGNVRVGWPEDPPVAQLMVREAVR